MLFSIKRYNPFEEFDRVFDDSMESEIAHYIKQYESSIEQLKKNIEHIKKQKSEITEKIDQIVQQKKKGFENPSKNAENSANKNHVFKKVHYKTNDMEIEEQYDSQNPKNCYKIIRNHGQAPQIINGEQSIGELKEEKESQKIEVEKLGEGLDEKLELLSKMTGKNQSQLKSFVLENKESSIGQLYDLAASQKLI